MPPRAGTPAPPAEGAVAAPRAEGWAAVAAKYAPVAVAAATMVVLGLWGLERSSSMGNDEVVTRWAALLSLHQLAHLLSHIDAVHGLYYLLMHGWMAVGTSPAVMRIPSVIGMTAAVALTVILARRLTGSGWAGLFAGLVMALTPTISYYAQTARSYALVMACVLGATLVLLRAMEAETTGGAGRRVVRRWLPYGTLVALAGYLNEMALLVLAAHGVTVLLARYGRRSVKHWLAAAAGGAALVVPLLVVSARETGTIGWISRPHLWDLKILFHDYFGPVITVEVLLFGCAVAALLPSRGRWRALPSVALPGGTLPGGTSPGGTSPGGTLPGGHGLRIGADDADAGVDDAAVRAADADAGVDDARVRAGDAEIRAVDAEIRADDARTTAADARTRADPAAPWWRRAGFCLPSVAAPLLVVPGSLLILESLIARPLYVDRYVLYGEAGAALLAGTGMYQLGRWLAAMAGPRALIWAPGVIVCLCTLVLQLGPQHRTRTPQIRMFDFGGPSRYVAAHARPGDGVLYFTDFYRKAELGYPADYRKVSDFSLAVPPQQTGTFQGLDKPLRTVLGLMLRHQRIWAVGRPPSAPLRPGRFLAESMLLKSRFSLVTKRHFRGVVVTLWLRR